MKNLILIVLTCAFTHSVHAEQSCTLEFDGDIYRISTLENIQVTQGTMIEQVTPYKAFNSVTKKYETAYAKVQYKVLASTQVESTPATCKDIGTGMFDYDRQVTAVQFEASSEAPIFGSPTDGANSKSIKAWAVCKGLETRECK